MQSISRYLVFLARISWIFAICGVTAAPSATAQVLANPDPQRVILLAPETQGGPAVSAVVQAVAGALRLSGALGTGDPLHAESLLAARATGVSAARLAAAPDSAAARLQRYVLLSYPAGTDLAAVDAALTADPQVEWVGPVRYGRLSAVEPNDPRFDDDPGGNPRPAEDHQWGSYALGLPEAWEYAKGYGLVGVIDTGIDADHPDLKPFGSLNQWIGGNYRPHLAYDYLNNETDVDEAVFVTNHGTHVAGIIGATTDNGIGVAGACWHCDLVISQVADENEVPQTAAAAAVVGSLDRGARVLNLSLGYRPDDPSGPTFDAPDCNLDPLDPFCVALDYAAEREVLVVSAAGNDGDTESDFPANAPRSLGVVGLTPQEIVWAGSNTDPTFLAAPAEVILSTFYEGVAFGNSVCDDDVDGAIDGYGPCTGTSMASPYLAASSALLRSVNPWLSPEDVKDLLFTNLDNPTGWNSQLAVGKPHVGLATEDALGRSGGRVLPNRLTPLFQLWGPGAEDHAYTTSPQVAAAMIDGAFYPGAVYRSVGTDVPGYDQFPGVPCSVSPCTELATASVYLFTTDHSPRTTPLVPLYRLSFEGTFQGGPSNLNNRDHTYARPWEIDGFVGDGYRVEGIEGYLWPICAAEPGCIPAGAVRLFRYYNASRDDWAVFPESELPGWVADGYAPLSQWDEVIGYVYETVDTDGDQAIDGFENLAGTDPTIPDSDNDGTSDGQELLVYPYGDPLLGPTQEMGEFGQLANLSHVPQTVLLSRTYVKPVVLAQAPSLAGADPSVVRITDVSSDRFTVYIDEAPDRDGPHAGETVSWLVVEAGNWRLTDGASLVVNSNGTSATVGGGFKGSYATPLFPQPFAAPPVVLHQVQTNRDPSFVKTRAERPGIASFQVALENEEASGGAHGDTETIGWIAIDAGAGTWSGHRYVAGDTGDVVTDAFHTEDLEGFGAPPALLTALASRDDEDNAALRYRNLGAGSFEVQVEEDTTLDSEVSHGTESVHYLAIEGSGVLHGVPRPL